MRNTTLLKSKEAQKDLEEHCKKYNYAYLVRKWGELEDKGLDYDEDEYKELEKLVQKYPNTTTSLSAKLIMAEVKDGPPNTRLEAVQICKEIIEEYPNHWQAILATWHIGQMLYADAGCNRDKVHKAIEYHLQNFERYKQLEIGRAHV